MPDLSNLRTRVALAAALEMGRRTMLIAVVEQQSIAAGCAQFEGG